MGATRDIALNELPMRGISVNPVAASGGVAAITIVPSDSGIVFANKYVTGAVTYTLPAVSLGAGKMFWFISAQGTVAENIAATTACIMGIDGTTGTTLTNDSDEGACMCIFGDGTNWFAIPIGATWTVA